MCRLGRQFVLRRRAGNFCFVEPARQIPTPPRFYCGGVENRYAVMVRVPISRKCLESFFAVALFFLSVSSHAIASMNTEALEERSWLARSELLSGNFNTALKDAQDTQKLCEQALAGKRLDDDPHLTVALGASFEVEAQSLERLHQKAEAVQLLENALKTWGRTSIAARLRKNLNLLTLEGKPLPLLRASEWIGARGPLTREALRGKVVLIFFGAHWCADCKAEAPVLEHLMPKLERRGLIIIAPTQRYGYTALSENTPVAEENEFIHKVFLRFYARIPAISVPLDSGNFERFGVSTTPTLVLADRQGIVRLYHPGYLAEDDLQAAADRLLGPAVRGNGVN
jgi:thiol-disulfide isomerase/thioredoxin